MMHRADPQHPTPELLLEAYAQGIFPMVDPRSGVIDWYSPDPRAIIPLDAFHVPQNLARVMRHHPFTIRCSTAFAQVMRECAAPRGDDQETWIDDRLVRLYTTLCERGSAHSIEAWRDGVLVGGLYGVVIGGAYFGESMFIRPERGGTNSSKVCLVALVRHMCRRGFRLLDTQFQNPHLERFGCIEIPRSAYRRRLADAIAAPVSWGSFEPDDTQAGC